MVLEYKVQSQFKKEELHSNGSFIHVASINVDFYYINTIMRASGCGVWHNILF